MRTLGLIVLGMSYLLVSGCETVTPQQQHAMDQQRCAGYGYAPGTDRFADCMMNTSQRREDTAIAQKRDLDYMKSLSIRRNGGERFPICSAADMDAHLDITTNSWFGPNCRER